MANKNITDLPGGTFAAGHKFEMFNTAANQNQSVTIPAGGAAGTQSFGMSNLGNTSGTTGIATGSQVQAILVGGNNITLSQSINGASATITVSAFNQTVESQSFGMSNLGNTSGTTGIASGGQVRFLLAGGNNITLSQSLNGASGTISISAASQSVQPGGVQSIGVINVGNTSGTTGAVISSAVQYILVGGNNITLSQSIDPSGTVGSATVTISAANQTVESQSFGMSNIGNTSGTTGIASGGQMRFLLAGGNNITLSQSLNGASGTITISAGAAGAAGTNTLGMSNVGNTSGDTAPIAASAMRLIFAGGNNVTLSQSTNGSSATVTISAFNQSVQTQNVVDVSLSGNTSGTLALISSGTMILAGGNNVTLSQNGQSVTISAGAGAAPTMSWWQNMAPQNTQNAQLGSIAITYDSIGVYPLCINGVFPGNMTVNTWMVPFNLSGSTATMSQSFSSSLFLGIYTLNVSTLSLLNSVSVSFGSGAANANLSTMRAGVARWWTVHSSAWSAQPVFTQGHYWIGMMVRSSNVSDQTCAYWGQVPWPSNTAWSGTIGISQVANTTVGFMPFFGRYSVSSAALPTAISSNDLNKQLAAMSIIPMLQFNNLIQSF